VRVIYAFGNALQHPFKIRDDLIVPETQHAIAFPLKLSGSPCICSFLPHVLPAIQFNHQAPFRAAEVDDIACHRVLAPELHTM
jgi:hypothetical protein